MVSIAAIADMVCINGTEFFYKESRDAGSEASNSTASSTFRLRKLFTTEEVGDIDVSNQSSMSFEGFVEVLVDIMDEEVKLATCF